METQGPVWDELCERLNNLERENRRWKWISAAVVIAAMVIVVEGTNLVRPSRVVEAEKFVVRDKSGQVRAVLGLDGTHAGELAFKDSEGNDQFRVYSGSDESSHLALYDRGRTRMMLSATRDGSAAVNLMGDRQGAAGSMYMHPEGSAGVYLSDGTKGVHLAAKTKGHDGLRFVDSEGTEQGGVGLDTDGSPAFTDVKLEDVRPVQPNPAFEPALGPGGIGH